MEWLWLLAIFILFAYTVEAVTGFGSIVIALSLGALLMPVPELLPILVPLNILMTGWLTLRYRQHIAVRLLMLRILPLMLAGTLLGYLLLPWLNERWLKPLFGILIIWFSGRELWRLGGFYAGSNGGNSTAANNGSHPSWSISPLMFSAGITHGLFASGGPLLVYALAGTTLDKTRFRATLICVWFLLNSVLTFAFFLDGRLLPALPALAWLVWLLPVGILLGEQLHRRVDEVRFRMLVYGLLLVTGMLLLVGSVISIVD